jgi:hypothetical protein
MPSALADAVKVVLELPVHQQRALANFLLDSNEAEVDPAVEAVWDKEIQARIRAIDEGRAIGVSRAEVMRQADEILNS